MIGAPGPHCFAIDYQETVRASGGATFTLSAQSIDDGQIKNRDDSSTPIPVPGVPPFPATYDGQFIQMDVVSVTPVP